MTNYNRYSTHFVLNWKELVNENKLFSTAFNQYFNHDNLDFTMLNIIKVSCAYSKDLLCGIDKILNMYRIIIDNKCKANNEKGAQND